MCGCSVVQCSVIHRPFDNYIVHSNVAVAIVLNSQLPCIHSSLPSLSVGHLQRVSYSGTVVHFELPHDWG